jgi:hypothetical protein
MKYIAIPAPVTACDIEGNPIVFNGQQEVVTLARFILSRLTDPKFSVSMANVIAAVAIRDAVKDSVAGHVALENDHYELLKELVKTPSQGSGYPPGIAHNLLPFMLAVVNGAEDKKPEA